MCLSLFVCGEKKGERISVVIWQFLNLFYETGWVSSFFSAWTWNITCWTNSLWRGGLISEDIVVRPTSHNCSRCYMNSKKLDPPTTHFVFHVQGRLDGERSSLREKTHKGSLSMYLKLIIWLLLRFPLWQCSCVTWGLVWDDDNGDFNVFKS